MKKKMEHTEKELMCCIPLTKDEMSQVTGGVISDDGYGGYIYEQFGSTRKTDYFEEAIRNDKDTVELQNCSWATHKYKRKKGDEIIEYTANIRYY